MINEKESFCPNCCIYWSENKHEKITWPVTNNPQMNFCLQCSNCQNVMGLLSTEIKLNQVFRSATRPSIIIPNKGDLIKIQFEINMPDNINLLKDDFEFGIINSVELQISGKQIDKIYDHQIYQHDKAIKKIVFIDNEKIIIDLPFSFNENFPLTYGNKNEIKLFFQFGHSETLLKDTKNKVVWSIPKLIFFYQKHTTINNGFKSYIFHNTNEEYDVLYNVNPILSYYLKFNFLINEITFGIYDKNDKEKSFNYLDIIDNINLSFNSIDFIYEKGYLFKNNDNVYKIIFQNPINFSAIKNVKLKLELKKENINIHNSIEEQTDMKIFISALSNNKLIYYDEKFCNVLYK